jgi:hypothetical protein
MTVSRSWFGPFGSTAAIASAADAPQIATAPPVNTPNAASSRAARASSQPKAIVTATATERQHQRARAERLHLFERYAHAEKRDARPQHGARGEIDSGPAPCVLSEEVHRDAQQEGEQHDGCAVVLR